MVEIEEIEKKRNLKWLLVIPIVIIIGTIGYFLLYTDTIKNPIPTTTIETTGTTTPTYTMIGGNIIFDNTVNSEEIINLNAGRYKLQFQSDSNVIITLNRNPNGFNVCCNADPEGSGSYNFDINSGAGGDYIMRVVGQTPISHVVISQSLAF